MKKLLILKLISLVQFIENLLNVREIRRRRAAPHFHDLSGPRLVGKLAHYGGFQSGKPFIALILVFRPSFLIFVHRCVI